MKREVKHLTCIHNNILPRPLTPTHTQNCDKEEEERALEEEALRQQNLNRLDDLESQKTSQDEPQ